MPAKRALVVDDSKSVLIMLRRMLEQNRLAVDTAESAEEALEYLRRQKPDVIFMDHILPGMNGLDATKVIVSDPSTAAIPVVIHSSKDGETFVKQAAAVGAAIVLPKPARPDSISRVLQTLSVLPDGPTAPVTRIDMKDASAALAPSSPPPPVASTTAIEAIARRAAESVVSYAAHSLVTRLLEDQLMQLKQDLLARSRIAAKEVFTELYAARFNELTTLVRRQGHDQLTEVQGQIDGLQARIDALKPFDPAALERIAIEAKDVAAQTANAAATHTAHSVARQAAQVVAEHTASATAIKVAGELYGTRLDELSDQMRQLQEQLAAVAARLDAPIPLSPSVAEEIRQLVKTQATRTATDTVTQAARRLADEAAAAAATRAGDVARRIVDPLLGSTRVLLSRMYVLAGAAAGVGVLAAVLVRLLR